VLLFRAVTYLPSIPLGALAYLWWRHPTDDTSRRVLAVPAHLRSDT
jgi:hypothetical protein